MIEDIQQRNEKVLIEEEKTTSGCFPKGDKDWSSEIEHCGLCKEEERVLIRLLRKDFCV